MNILVINGSPKGKKSNTYRLTDAFLRGVRQAEKDAVIEELTVYDMDIKPCRGCFACWSKTPGQCCMQDDMQEALEKMRWADLLIWSFPLYYYNIPGKLKSFMDRQLPMVLPFMTERTDGVGSGSHPARYAEAPKKAVLISTCGFYTAEKNYDSVTEMFDREYGKDAYTTIFCGQGELFRVPELSARTDAYLESVRQAGEEYAKGGIHAETRARLSELLYPKETFEKMADASWGLDETGEKEDESLVFTKQMAALYRKEAWAGKDLVLEMSYTDIGQRYQIVLGKDGSTVLPTPTQQYTTCIETPISVWRSIAAGEIRGDTALMQGRYKVKGDFNLLLHWEDYFGGGENEPEKSAPSGASKSKASKRAADMKVLLQPWLVFWFVPAIDAYYGALITAAVCLLLPLWTLRRQKTVYDALSIALVGGLSLASLLGAPSLIVMPLSYGLFGLMWGISCFLKIPLTAWYSNKDYGGEKVLDNPIFIKTNRILTAAWSILYLITPVWTALFLQSSVPWCTWIFNTVFPMALGAFTAWFQKWYPAKIIRGD